MGWKGTTDGGRTGPAPLEAIVLSSPRAVVLS